MKKISVYTVLTIIFSLMSLSLFNKYIELKNIVPDGDGIGIYFFPFVNNERVPNAQIPAYRDKFLMLAILVLLMALYSLYRAIILKDNNILMVHSNKGDYKFPGGGINKEEKHEEALKEYYSKRETK